MFTFDGMPDCCRLLRLRAYIKDLKDANLGEKEMDKIIEILKQIRADVDYESEKALIDDGIFDSFDVVSIVSELMSEFDIEISVDDMVPENFNSVEAINALVEKILDEE